MGHHAHSWINSCGPWDEDSGWLVLGVGPDPEGELRGIWKRRRDLGAVTRKRGNGCRAGDRWQDATVPRMHKASAAAERSGGGGGEGEGSLHSALVSFWTFKHAPLTSCIFYQNQVAIIANPSVSHEWKCTSGIDSGSLDISLLSLAKGMPNPHDSWLIQVQKAYDLLNGCLMFYNTDRNNSNWNSPTVNPFTIFWSS